MGETRFRRDFKTFQRLPVVPTPSFGVHRGRGSSPRGSWVRRVVGRVTSPFLWVRTGSGVGWTRSCAGGGRSSRDAFSSPGGPAPVLSGRGRTRTAVCPSLQGRRRAGRVAHGGPRGTVPTHVLGPTCPLRDWFPVGGLRVGRSQRKGHVCPGRLRDLVEPSESRNRSDWVGTRVRVIPLRVSIPPPSDPEAERYVRGEDVVGICGVPSVCVSERGSGNRRGLRVGSLRHPPPPGRGRLRGDAATQFSFYERITLVPSGQEGSKPPRDFWVGFRCL